MGSNFFSWIDERYACLQDFPFVVRVLDGGGYGYFALVEGRTGFVVSFMDSQDGVCVGERALLHTLISHSSKKRPETLRRLEVIFFQDNWTLE